MSVDHPIVSEIFKGITFTTEESLFILSKFEKIILQKGELLLHANEVVYYQYYVQQGCLRTYSMDSAGKEHTLQFAISDWWISDYTAFFSNTTAIMSIECIQEAVIYKISKEHMEQLFLELPKIETFFRKKMEKAFASFQKRILGTLSMSAQERYNDFIQTYPNIEQNVKNYHIASYLGITTESLSRIRKRIAKT
ncbi:Crp/Fnr family transcriptional regulator [Wenyingzhuangia aestuarii]|uniref:Crp/Fnr family transcriptional regulator n=1 Tax=Wenyingzhuangia aestuarii TaxID=1647582 RepID=UPI00143AC9CD|nr:Crp/Fnr family transcriptional regulator [Wenyingzhuangia aestuarii]NJB81891.1 CRP-like cAMP-binding protein [Wenyingzhuangia aestuarii]